MAALPQTVSKTVEMIYAAYEAKALKNEPLPGGRPHLGASVIGRPCDREIWLSFRWAGGRKSFDGRMLRLFETGHMAEARFMENLRMIGITAYDVDEETGGQFQVSAHGGHFGGSLDGCAINVPEAPRTWHVLEFKTHGEKSFLKLKKDGVQKAKPEHFAQMQIYMHLTGMPRALYVAVNKNTDELYSERIEVDVEFALRMLARAERIIFADGPPTGISIDPSWFECRFCDLQRQCFDKENVTRTCRTCCNITPMPNGQWHCTRWGIDIPTDDQRLGCAGHRLLPDLVPGEQVDFTVSTNPQTKKEYPHSITYKMKDGTSWTDGDPMRKPPPGVAPMLDIPRWPAAWDRALDDDIPF